ncbi:hypothetical protein F4802DRAFT_596135 [Xylaria palmicola]|nr:hypothetical protein F4802DRAFT_596135 [Xylaria palmicola]
MAQHGTVGWTIDPAGSGMDGVNTGDNDAGFVAHVDHNAGSYIEGPASHENPYDHVGYAPSTNPYGQQDHGPYANQPQYSNLAFGVDGQPSFHHDFRSLRPTQVPGQSHSNDYQQPNVPYTNNQNTNFRQYLPRDLAGQYSEFAQPQQHVRLNDFQRNSWTESQQAQHGSPTPYTQGQQIYSNNPSLIRITTTPPSHMPTTKTEQTQPSYKVDPASPYQTQVYGGTYQTQPGTEVRHTYPTQVPLSVAHAAAKNNPVPNPSPVAAAAASHPLAWQPQGQVQRLGNASIPSISPRNTPPTISRTLTTDQSKTAKLGPTQTNVFSNDIAVFVSMPGKPGEGCAAVKGCPNLFMGLNPVRRQVVTNTPGVKPHVAGDNRNGTRLLPLLSNPLPCEILREKVRPLMDELKKVGESIDKTKEQIKVSSVGSDEHKKYIDELRKLEGRMASVESEKKRITGKVGSLKVEKARATGKSEAMEYESESLSESSEEDDVQELIVQQIIASATRPTDPQKGVQYDVVRIIRNEFTADRGMLSQGEKEDPWSKVIGRRVADYGKYVVDLCAEARVLREQKSSAPKSQSSQLQAAIDQKYDLVRVALETAIEFGDEETLRNMGQHMKLMSSLTVALSRQCANKAYNSDVSRSILRFFSEATLMDLEVFQKVKLSAVLEKYGNNLDDEGKQLVAEITQNAEERTAKNVAEKPTASGQPKQKPSDNVKENHNSFVQKTTTLAPKGAGTTPKLQAPQLTSTAVSETARKETKAYSGLISARKMANNADKAAVKASPSKRQRDDDTDSRATKKVAVESNVGGTGIGRTTPAAVTNSTTPPSTMSNSGQPRPRPLGSTVLNKSRAAPRPPTKKPEPLSSVSSTISGLLAEIAKPAEKPKPQERVVKAPETPEERTHRLRKEARRGRTVTWKPDDELVQTRFFEHDSTEDEGRAGNMIRDARDNRLEGQMLKQMQRSMQEGDDDDDDGNPTETDIRPWVTPQPFDYSVLDSRQKEKNYVTRGGTREIHSEQKKIMEEYENRELMSIYTTLSDIPDTPRSPPKSTSEPFGQPIQALLQANDPKTKEILARWQEFRQFGTMAAVQSALRRLGLSSHGAISTSTYTGTGLSTKQSQMNSEVHMMTQEERDARVLALLLSNKAKSYVDPDPYNPANAEVVHPPESRDEQVQKAFSIIQNLVDQLKNMPTRPTATAPDLSTQIQGAHAGYSHDLAAKVAGNTQSQYSAPQISHFATYQPQTQQQSQSYSQFSQVPDQYAAILQQVQALQSTQAAQNPAVSQPMPAQPENSLASLLATLGHSAQPVPAATQDPKMAAWQAWAQSQAQSYGAQSQVQSQDQSQSYTSYSQQYDNTSRDESYQSQGQYNRDSGDRGNRKEFHRGTKDHKGINRALIGTKPCTFWAKGQCAKGDSCTFRHDPNDLK